MRRAHSAEDPAPQVAVLTGGGDRPYALGLASALMQLRIPFDYISSDAVDSPELHHNPLVRVLNLFGARDPAATVPAKVWRVLRYYARLLGYAAVAKPRIFHILWNGKLELLDRTLLMLYFRILGKRVVLTAHNVNARWRDGNDTLLNRMTLRTQYRLADHLFVHTAQMKQELESHFAVPAIRITVIPFGINSTLPKSALTSPDAKRQCGLAGHEKVCTLLRQHCPVQRS